MVTEYFWNDVDGHSGLHIGDKLIATIHQESDVFYLVAVAGSVRYCYHKLNANNLEQAKKVTVDLLFDTYWEEYIKHVDEANAMFGMCDSLNDIAKKLRKE